MGHLGTWIWVVGTIFAGVAWLVKRMETWQQQTQAEAAMPRLGSPEASPPGSSDVQAREQAREPAILPGGLQEAVAVLPRPSETGPPGLAELLRRPAAGVVWAEVLGPPVGLR